MPFVNFTVTKSVVGTGFGASLMKMGRGERHARLAFFLTQAVADQLGWADADRLDVLMGEDEQHGLVRLRKAEAGTAMISRREATRGGHFFQILFGHVPQFVDRAESKKWCKFDAVEDGWTEVVLPSWADETGVKRQRAVAAAVTPHRLALAPPSPRPMAGRLPGDPPPGRSALDSRSPTRGQARRLAEEREEPDHVVAEAIDQERHALDDDRLADLMTNFGLTRTEALYLRCLMDGRLKTREALFDVGDHGAGEADIKIVDVFIHKLRKKLQTRLVSIETVRALGYQMDEASIDRVLVVIGVDESEAAE